MSFTVENARAQFPALRDKVVFDSAGVGIAPRVAVEAIDAFLHQVSHCPVRSMLDHHLAIDQAREAARREAARLIGAGQHEIALVESTTHGLNLAARAIPLQAGDNIITTDLEYIQVPLPWRQPETGIAPEIRVVQNRDGRLPVSLFEDEIDARTRAITVSSVQWSNGFRCDLKRLSDLCRRHDIFLVVDAIQQLGAFPLSVGEIPLDFLACGGHKWLNAPFGAGFLYVREGIADRLNPLLKGHLALDPPKGGWGDFFQSPSSTPFETTHFTRQARRFENGGTSNYPGAIGLAASLKMINELGPDSIQRRIRALTDHLIQGLERQNLKVVTPREPESRSGIVVFNCGGGTEQDLSLKEALLDQKILTSVRYTSGVGGLRVSCHFYNSHEDVDRLLEAVSGFSRSPSSSAQ